VKSRRTVIIVAAVVVALAVAIVVLARLNRSDTVVATGSIAIVRDGATLGTFTVEQVRALRSVDAEKTLHSSSHADEKGVFTGAPLRVVLEEVSPALLDDASQVVVRATDGYVSSLDVDEVAGGDDVLLVYAKDGESLGDADDGGTGPFRIVIVSDPFGNRSAKWVNEIEIL